MLKNGRIYDKPSKKGTSYFIMEATNNNHEKAGGNTSILETTIALLNVVNLHHHIKILIVQPMNLKLLQIFLHHK